jgi:hypothetical protein
MRHSNSVSPCVPVLPGVILCYSIIFLCHLCHKKKKSIIILIYRGGSREFGYIHIKRHSDFYQAAPGAEYAVFHGKPKRRGGAEYAPLRGGYRRGGPAGRR